MLTLSNRNTDKKRHKVYSIAAIPQMLEAYSVTIQARITILTDAHPTLMMIINPRDLHILNLQMMLPWTMQSSWIGALSKTDS
jgi:hypothetical protein